jgi:hypothetical protein
LGKSLPKSVLLAKNLANSGLLGDGNLEIDDGSVADSHSVASASLRNRGDSQLGRVDIRVPSRNCMQKCKRFLAGVTAMWLGCVCQVPSRAIEDRRSNWTSVDAPCGKYDRLREPLLGTIGVKIDVSGPWAEGFRRALRFWNAVLAADFHEETNLGACSVRIIDGGPDILNRAIVARAQITEWADFQGKIAVNPGSAKEMSSTELYAAAVHELGHMLGLKHNVNIHSVMYFLDVDGTESLDSKDVLDLSMHHKLRPY